MKEADVLVVDEDVYETADISTFIADSLKESWKRGVQVLKDLTNCRAFGSDEFLFVGEFAEWGRDADLGRHMVILVDMSMNRSGWEATSLEGGVGLDKGFEFAKAGFDDAGFTAFSMDCFLSL